MHDTIVLESTGSRPDLATDDQYKVDLYYPILDSFLAEINRRFTNENVEVMKAIQACSPDSDNFLEPDSLTPLIEAYDLDGRSIRMEGILAKRSLKDKEIRDISELICELYPLKSAFPTLLKLLQIALTIVVTTSECERTFSALKRIKTYLLSTMTNERLSDLAVLSIE